MLSAFVFVRSSREMDTVGRELTHPPWLTNPVYRSSVVQWIAFPYGWGLAAQFWHGAEEGTVRSGCPADSQRSPVQAFRSSFQANLPRGGSQACRDCTSSVFCDWWLIFWLRQMTDGRVIDILVACMSADCGLECPELCIRCSFKSPELIFLVWMKSDPLDFFVCPFGEPPFFFASVLLVVDGVSGGHADLWLGELN